MGKKKNKKNLPAKLSHKVDNMYSMERLSVFMLKQETLTNIFDMCLPFADDSEFQVHYRSITFECRNEDNNGLVYFTVPTVFYNMEQEVTSVHIDYHTDDIYEEGEAVKPISLLMGQSPEVAKIHTMLSAYFDKVSTIEIADNSIHRHPMDGGFSSTDYDDDPDEPGVIFRKGPCHSLLQTDSVMYLGKEAKLVETESRVVTVDKALDGTVTAKYIEIPTKTYMTKTKDSSIRRMFGIEPQKTFIKMNSDLSKESFSELDDMVQEIMEVLPEPNLEFIEPDKITQKKYSTTVTHCNYGWDRDDGIYTRQPQYPTPSQREVDEAAEMGYDLTSEDDKEEWYSYREYFYSRGA